MTNAVIDSLLAELAGRGIRLVVQQGELVARGPAGAMTADLAGRLKQHKAALLVALSARPAAPVAEPKLLDSPAAATPAAPSAPVEAVEAVDPLAVAEQPAPAVAKPTELAATVGLPPGWPEDVPQPPWWAEFLSIKGDIQILAARRQVCGDDGCSFPVMIQWTLPGDALRLWSCPRCGRTAAAGQLR